MRHYYKRYNTCFFYLIDVGSKKIINRFAFENKQTNKQTPSVGKKRGIASYFNPGNQRRSINSPKKDTSYCYYGLVFVPHHICPLLLKIIAPVKVLDWLRVFIKQVKAENLLRSRAVDVPCFFHVLELTRKCSHRSVVEENADPPWCLCNCEKLKMKLTFYY